MRSVLPREKNNGEANQASSRSDIRNQVRVSQTTQGAAGKCFSRTQRCCALQSSEGRYRSGTSCCVEADTVCRKAIRSGTSRVRIAGYATLHACHGSGIWTDCLTVDRWSPATACPRTFVRFGVRCQVRGNLDEGSYVGIDDWEGP